MVNIFDNVTEFKIMSFVGEIQEPLKSRITACVHKDGKLEVHTNGDDLTSAELAELTTYVLNHNPSAYSEPRIYSLAKHEAKEKHFHNIDYKKELNHKLQMSVTFGEPGLFTLAQLFEDEAKTIPVLDVIREYDIEPVTGKLLRKHTKRQYYNEDGSLNEEIKDSGWYTYTEEQSRAATHRRRVNITNKLESDMLNMLVQAAQGDPAVQAANIAGGAAFMKALTPGINVFHMSGDNADIVSYVSDSTVQSTFTFLTQEVAPGVQAYQFIIAGVTY